MSPVLLVPETTATANGQGPVVALNASGIVEVTLGITRSVEQESLDVQIWGSADMQEWGVRPLCSFPQKFYNGTYSLVLDLSRHPGVKFLKIKWKMNRWGRGKLGPVFSFYVAARQIGAEAAAAGA
jgi:hypothetical protein